MRCPSPGSTASPGAWCPSTTTRFSNRVAFVVLACPRRLMVYADVEERRGMPHRDAKNLHAALNGGATVLLMIGLAVIFANHAGHGIPPMYSAHSWLGILTASLVACQALVGTAAYLVPSALGVTQETRAALMPHHRFLGCVTFLLGVATCAAGARREAGLHQVRAGSHRQVFAPRCDSPTSPPSPPCSSPRAPWAPCTRGGPTANAPTPREGHQSLGV